MAASSSSRHSLVRAVPLSWCTASRGPARHQDVRLGARAVVVVMALVGRRGGYDGMLFWGS